MSARGMDDRFVFSGAVADEGKWSVYRRADCFVLPTHTENFGIVIAEALYAGLPVVTTTGAPWGELVAENCGWWIDFSVADIVVALREVLSLSDDQRRVMGYRGKALVERRYAWASIANMMVNEYATLLK